MHDKNLSKLSKRNGSKSINDFKKEGILPISILNYLARLGWSHGDQEIFTLNEMMELFDINNLTKSPAIFDENKLKWVNTQHIKALKNTDLLSMLGMKFIENINIDLALSVSKEKGKDIASIKESLHFCQIESIKIGKEFEDIVSGEETRKMIKEFYIKISDIDMFNIDEIKNCMQIFLEEKNLKMKELGLPLRIILTGSKVSPGIFEIISILGKAVFQKRVEDYLRL